MPLPKELDRSLLSPLAIEAIDTRDAILRLLLALGDDRKRMMVLTYVNASLVKHLAAATGHTAEACVVTIASETLSTLAEDVMTVDLATVEH
jgi:hypothetical protein